MTTPAAVLEPESAFQALTTLIGGSHATRDPRVVRLWDAPCMTRSGHPLERCTSLGAALILILKGADVRARLDRVEFNRDVPDVTLIWNRGSRLVFAPFDSPRAWRRRVTEAAEAGKRFDRVTCQPRATFDKVAALIVAEATGQVGTA